MDGQSLDACTVRLLPVRSGAVEVWLCVRRDAPALEHVLALCALQVDDLLRERAAAPQSGSMSLWNACSCGCSVWRTRRMLRSTAAISQPAW